MSITAIALIAERLAAWRAERSPAELELIDTYERCRERVYDDLVAERNGGHH